MTKQRIILSSRQIQQDKARAVQRARNGAVDKCILIIKEKIQPYTSYILNNDRVILPLFIIEEIHKELKEVKK